ncbi:MAG TPA: TonB-dependent receptor plug domain-containing protein, partial [Gammaproteobacteria bacterium]
MKSGLLLCVLLVPAAAASDVARLEGISVSHRGGWFASPAAPSVTYLDGDALREQLAAGRSLADVLAELVPGMAPASGTFTNSNQTVRGRALQLLIDGVPQGTNRNVSRDLFAVDPDAIERIEVIRGASTMFGGGAAGGLINVVTKNPLPGAVALDTRLGMRTSLTGISSDSLSFDLHQGATGGGEIWSWRVDATWRDLAAEFDADGNRLAPEPSQGDLF